MNVMVSYSHEVPMGHRLMAHPGRCKFVHGHNYTVITELTGEVDIATGMVIDFHDLKAAVRDVLDYYDHAFVVQEGDPVGSLLTHYAKLITITLPPTAEILCDLWRSEIAIRLLVPVEALNVIVYETSGNAVRTR